MALGSPSADAAALLTPSNGGSEGAGEEAVPHRSFRTPRVRQAEAGALGTGLCGSSTPSSCPL